MEEITTIGVDLAKSVFQVHAVGADGKVVLRRQLRRSQMLAFFARLAPCLIGMEACAGAHDWAHDWARELTKSGHELRLMPLASGLEPVAPSLARSYVKPYVKRGSEADRKTVRGTVFPPNDAIDAEAIWEAVTRPNMRFVPIKTKDQQATLMTHRTRDFLVRQQIQLSNAIRAHLAEFGIVVAKGVHNVGRLLTLAEDATLPAQARQSIRLLAEQFRDTHARIDMITATIKACAQGDAVAGRLQTIPGIGPITASAIAASVPDVSNFKAARDLPASC